MGLSDILNRIKAALGIGGPSRQQAPQQPPQQGQHQQSQPDQQNPPSDGQQEQAGTNVTVEREPSTESEDAVKGTETGSEGAEDSDEETTESEQPAAVEDDDLEADESTDDDLGTDESTDVIKGIGSAYAERLAEAGIETVADLAQGDAESLTEETGISEKRLQNWIDRAKHR